MKRWGIVILVVVSLWVAGASGQQRQVAAPVQRWEYAELSRSTATHELLWLAEGVEVRGDPAKVAESLGKTDKPLRRLFVSDVLAQAGREGWELVAVQREGETAIPTYWFKRPAK